MKCNECAPLLEDALYRNLDAATEKGLAEHLAACDSCAREYALLGREQELYACCELQLAPEFWSGVLARIASENGSRTQRFAGLFSAFRFAPVTAVTCLLVVLGSIGLWRYVETPRDNSVAGDRQNPPPVSVAPLDQKSVPITESNPGQVVSHQRNPKLPRASRAYARKIETHASGADAVVEQNKMAPERSLASNLDAESARHLEQVEMLLRSFKNGRFLRNSNTLDLSYESRLSKDLLVRNVLLRRDAELAGDVPLTRLLDQFEPFLVDIANLRDDSDANEIRQVRESLTKAQIIAALHSF